MPLWRPNTVTIGVSGGSPVPIAQAPPPPIIPGGQLEEEYWYVAPNSKLLLPNNRIITNSNDEFIVIATGSGAPEPVVGDTILLGPDSFEYANWAAMSSAGWTRNSNVTPDWATGRTGGQSIHFPYTSTNGGDPVIEHSFTQTVDLYFRYWFRISPGGLPYSGATGSGMKWFMPWRISTSLRWTMGVGTLPGGPPGFTNTGYEFSGHDNLSPSSGPGAMPNPFMQNINKSIRFNTTNDGNWHKYTLHINTDPLGNGSGAGGFHQLWVDDVRLADSRPNQPGVPSTGYTTGAEGIGLIQMPGLVVDGIPDPSWNFTIDIDDLVIWHK